MIYPAFGNRPDAQTETVSQTFIGMIFGRHAHCGKRVNSRFHRAVIRDSVILANGYKGCGFACGVIIGMTCVLYHRHTWLRNSRNAAEFFYAVGRNGCRHSSARAAAPYGITVRIHAEHFGVCKNKGNRSRQIFVSRLRAGAINDCESIVTAFGKFESVRKTIVHSADVSESAARTGYRKLRVFLAAEEE